jgi:hypothetical protein
MGLPEAEKRQATALKLALDPAGFSADTVKGVLAGLPEEGAPAASAAARPGTATPSISQRAEDQREIGANGKPEGAAPEAVQKGWSKAFGRAA